MQNIFVSNSHSELENVELVKRDNPFSSASNTEY